MQHKILKCKRRLHKATYNRLAFKKGHTYVVAKEERDLLWVIDEIGGEMSFTIRNDRPDMYYWADYFDSIEIVLLNWGDM